MSKSNLHRPLWLGGWAAGLVITFDLYWLFTFIDLPRPHAELGDAAMRLAVIHGLVIGPVFLVAYALAVWAVTLAICGRGQPGPDYSSSSRILTVLLCAAAFGFHHFGLWPVIQHLHASRHPELITRWPDAGQGTNQQAGRRIAAATGASA